MLPLRAALPVFQKKLQKIDLNSLGNTWSYEFEVLENLA